MRDGGQKPLSVRWVITEKIKEGISHVKARLLVRGFEEQWCADDSRDSPTCTKDSFRIVLTLCSAMKWQVRSLDIKSAFL